MFAGKMARVDNPMQRPEGKLIQHAMQRLGVKAPWVGERTNLSANWVRHVINGYEPQGQGRKNEVIGAPDTIARIAHVLDITPDQLAAAGRPDAAEVLEAIQQAMPHVAAGTIDRGELEAIADNRNRPDSMRRRAKSYLAVLDTIADLLQEEHELREQERRAG
ncbi:hypothetical protein [Micromonospora sp. NPDC005652]|uniref:hypothetical protein n=1 Tax=Micromonospora sp. NPDC005652 TaxID=3157046 RepID=UPI00340D13B2